MFKKKDNRNCFESPRISALPKLDKPRKFVALTTVMINTEIQVQNFDIITDAS